MLKKFLVPAIVILFLLSLFKVAKVSSFLFQLFFTHGVNLKQVNGKVNILLLGAGGANHDGPNLTDTMIFASLDVEKEKVTLLSIPRDLWVPDLNGRINTAYSNAESQQKGGGILVVQAVVKKIMNQSIDYTVKIDFSGFVKAIDLLGRINVNVENGFDDYKYPIDGKENDLCGHNENDLAFLATASSQLEAFPCRYKHIHFDQGMQKMNGETALEFVRSRHAEGMEGTDFARSKRQEEVITAVKTAALSLNVLLNPSKIIGLYSTVKNSIDTNIKEDEFDDFIRLAGKMNKAKIQSAVLDYGDDQTGRPGLLIHPEISSLYNNEWVLIPRIGDNNYQEIQSYVTCEINSSDCPISKNPQR